MKSGTSAVLVKGYFSNSGMETVEFTPEDLSVHQETCLACLTGPLYVLVTLVGNKGKDRLRVGCCSSCGYVGYMDRVPKDWLAHYYKEVWDGAAARDVEREVMRRIFPSQKDKMKAELAKRLVGLAKDVDRNAYLCDVGAGYGYTLSQLRAIGFLNVIGMEPSQHRAEIGSRASNLSILNGLFEDAHIQKELRSRFPIGLFFSHHVLEHTYDPNDIFSHANALQREGDYLAFTFPNFFGEKSFVTLFCWHHQHLFTPKAFEAVLNRHGYEIVDDSMTDNHQLACVAQKKANPKRKYTVTSRHDYRSIAIQKFRYALNLDKRPQGNRSLYERFYRILNSQRIVYSTKLLGAMHWWVQSYILDRKKNSCGIVASFPRSRFLAKDESPIEIQFEGNIKMLYE